MMQFTVLIMPVVALLLASPAIAADDSRTFYDAAGRVTGSATTDRNVTTFRDASGRVSGTATRSPDGRIEFRDAQGRLTGTTNK
jgi:YD repeat-containing protein